MDEDFILGTTSGLTIQCSDGIERVFYLRIMTYSMDYCYTRTGRSSRHEVSVSGVSFGTSALATCDAGMW